MSESHPKPDTGSPRPSCWPSISTTIMHPRAAARSIPLDGRPMSRTLRLARRSVLMMVAALVANLCLRATSPNRRGFHHLPDSTRDSAIAYLAMIAFLCLLMGLSALGIRWAVTRRDAIVEIGDGLPSRIVSFAAAGWVVTSIGFAMTLVVGGAAWHFMAVGHAWVIALAILCLLVLLFGIVLTPVLAIVAMKRFTSRRPRSIPNTPTD